MLVTMHQKLRTIKVLCPRKFHMWFSKEYAPFQQFKQNFAITDLEKPSQSCLLWLALSVEYYSERQSITHWYINLLKFITKRVAYNEITYQKKCSYQSIQSLEQPRHYMWRWHYGTIKLADDKRKLQPSDRKLLKFDQTLNQPSGASKKHYKAKTDHVYISSYSSKIMVTQRPP